MFTLPNNNNNIYMLYPNCCIASTIHTSLSPSSCLKAADRIVILQRQCRVQQNLLVAARATTSFTTARGPASSPRCVNRRDVLFT